MLRDPGVVDPNPDSTCKKKPVTVLAIKKKLSFESGSYLIYI